MSRFLADVVNVFDFGPNVRFVLLAALGAVNAELLRRNGKANRAAAEDHSKTADALARLAAGQDTIQRQLLAQDSRMDSFQSQLSSISK